MIKLTPGEMAAAAWVNVTDERDNPGRAPLFRFVPGGVEILDPEDARFVILPMLEHDKRREVGEQITMERAAGGQITHVTGATSWAAWRPHKSLAGKIRRALGLDPPPGSREISRLTTDETGSDSR